MFSCSIGILWIQLQFQRFDEFSHIHELDSGQGTFHKWKENPLSPLSIDSFLEYHSKKFHIA